MKGGDDDSAERTAELENFHAVLQDVSMGLASERVRRFIVQSYVRGTLYCATSDNAELEGNTAVFTKRRFLTCPRRRCMVAACWRELFCLSAPPAKVSETAGTGALLGSATPFSSYPFDTRVACTLDGPDKGGIYTLPPTPGPSSDASP